MIAELVLLAIGLVGTSMFVFGLFHVPFVVSAIAGVAIAGVLVRRAPHVHFSALPTALTIVPLIVVAFDSAVVPLHDFDGRLFWMLKAKALAHERRIDGPFFRGESVFDPRNQYPLLLPLDAAAVMIGTRSLDTENVRWLYVALFAAMVFHVRNKLARFVDPSIAAWCAVVLAWVPQFAVVEEGGVLSAYSDVGVAAFTAAAFFELVERRSPFRFGLWLAFLTLTKNEGLAIAIVFLILGIFSFRWSVARAAVPFVIVAAALFDWRHRVPITDEEATLSLLPTLPQHLGRFAVAVTTFLGHTVIGPRWGLLWFAAIAALALLAWRREWEAPAVVASVIAVYIVVYMVTRWNIRDLVDATADRLLMHVIGPALFAIARVSDPTARSR
ncbi:MAG TPA: hypothetical protein VIO12_08265 [Thermoanaerobaculia bacterium]